MPYWHLISTGILGLDIKNAHVNATPWPTLISYIAVFPWVFTGYEFFLGDDLGPLGFVKQPWNNKVVIYLIIVAFFVLFSFWLMQYAPETPCSNDDYAASLCIP